MWIRRPHHGFPRYTAASDDTDDYFVVIYTDYVDIYKNSDRIYAKAIECANLSSAVYMDHVLYYTKKQDNTLYAINLQNRKEKCSRIDGYGDAIVLKYISRSHQWLVIETSLLEEESQEKKQEYVSHAYRDIVDYNPEDAYAKMDWKEEDFKETIVYDWIHKETLFKLPMPYLIDCSFLDNKELVLMGEGTSGMFCTEDGDGENEKFLSIIKYDCKVYEYITTEIDSLNIISMYDSWQERLNARVKAKDKMSFPLFNKYLYCWLVSKSISSHGRFAIYYCKDIDGLIISNCRNGEVYRIFKLPLEINKEMQYYFNEKTNVISVLNGGEVKCYYMFMKEPNLVTILNAYYSNESGDLQHNSAFKDLLYRTIFSTKCLGANDMKYKYDVALSFAGEDREYVSKVNTLLKQRAIKVFYDEDNKAELWGQDLPLTLDEIYRKDTKFCMVFCSKNYRDKKWPKIEKSSYKAAQIESGRYDYILPVLIDDTEIPGILTTQGNLDSRKLSAEKIVDIFIEKLFYFDNTP